MAVTAAGAALAALCLVSAACGKKNPLPAVMGGHEVHDIDFILACNGPDSFERRNTYAFETPFMHLPYETKHALTDAQMEEPCGLSWFLGIRSNEPEKRIMLRYTATREGTVPSDFQQYLRDEMNSLKRFLDFFKNRGCRFDYVEVGDEFNLAGMQHLGFSYQNVLDYYDRACRIIDSVLVDPVLYVDIIPVYMYSDSVFSPGGGADQIRLGFAVPDSVFIRDLQARGTPFDGVGIEIQPGAHTFHDTAVIRRYIRSFTELGLDVHIWEFWILSRPLTNPTPMEADIYGNNAPPGGYSEAWQASELAAILEIFDEEPRVKGFNYMGFIDGLDLGYSSEPYPGGLLRADGSEKPAFRVYADWMQRRFGVDSP